MTGRSMPRQAFFWKACQDINGEFELDRVHRSVGVAVVTGDDLQDLDAHPEVSHAWLLAIMHVGLVHFDADWYSLSGSVAHFQRVVQFALLLP